MCRYTPELPSDEVEVQEFTLAERKTFLEFVPVRSGLRKSFSSPSSLVRTNDSEIAETHSPCDSETHSEGVSQKSPRPTWSRQESAATTASSFGSGWNRQVSSTWGRQISATSNCWTLNEDGSEAGESDGCQPDLAIDLEICKIRSNGSDNLGILGSARQRSVGAARHAQGDCKPCAWFWRPGGCTRGEACRHCHLCPPGALQKKKRQNRQMLRAQRAKAKATSQ
eukprot:Skav219221  [mRNA]  locus=scaffold1015:106809:107483:+ [translate_table: standard]